MTKERYLELKRICRNYAYYEDCIKDLYGVKSSFLIRPKKTAWHEDEVFTVAAMIEYYKKILEKIEMAANVCKPELYNWILKGVTEGVSYDAMSSNPRLVLPCGRRLYYKEYKRYFEELDRLFETCTHEHD